MLACEFPAVFNCFKLQPIAAAFRALNFSFCMYSFVLTKQSAVLQSFQHLQRSSDLNTGNCGRCDKCNSLLLLWWFSGWVVVWVRWWCLTGTELWYWDGQDQYLVNALGHYQEQQSWTLDSWTSDSFHSQPLLAWPSPVSQHHYLTAISSAIFQPYTGRPVHILKLS